MRGMKIRRIPPKMALAAVSRHRRAPRPDRSKKKGGTENPSRSSENSSGHPRAPRPDRSKTQGGAKKIHRVPPSMVLASVSRRPRAPRSDQSKTTGGMKIRRVPIKIALVAISGHTKAPRLDQSKRKGGAENPLRSFVQKWRGLQFLGASGHPGRTSRKYGGEFKSVAVLRK